MRILNSNRFYLPGTSVLHLASISEGMREYICFHMDGKIYIEEITGGLGPFRVEDDDLHADLCRFVEERNLLRFPMLPDDWKRQR